VPEGIRAVLVHLHLFLSTKQARGILKREVTMSDFIWQTANLAGFISGCYTNDLDMIRASFEAVVIEKQRSQLIPGFDSVRKGAIDAGADGIVSGAGLRCLPGRPRGRAEKCARRWSPRSRREHASGPPGRAHHTAGARSAGEPLMKFIVPGRFRLRLGAALAQISRLMAACHAGSWPEHSASAFEGANSCPVAEVMRPVRRRRSCRRKSATSFAMPNFPALIRGRVGNVCARAVYGHRGWRFRREISRRLAVAHPPDVEASRPTSWWPPPVTLAAGGCRVSSAVGHVVSVSPQGPRVATQAPAPARGRQRASYRVNGTDDCQRS
jgi:hypothetical protein